MGLRRSVAWYRLKGRDDAPLRHRRKVLAGRYPRYGYLTLHEMLKQEGRVINRNRTYRLYREEGLQVRSKRRKKITRPRVPMSGPTRANERWSADFMSDQLANGRRLRIRSLNPGNFTRQHNTEFRQRARVPTLPHRPIASERFRRRLGWLSLPLRPRAVQGQSSPAGCAVLRPRVRQARQRCQRETPRRDGR